MPARMHWTSFVGMCVVDLQVRSTGLRDWAAACEYTNVKYGSTKNESMANGWLARLYGVIVGAWPVWC